LYLLFKNLKHNLFLSSNFSTYNKIVIFINSIIGIITFWTQFYIICFYSHSLPFSISILSIFTLAAYVFISIFSLLKTSKLEITNQNLDQAIDYNNTLHLLYDNIRTFRHDFGNIVQAIGGYIDTDDIIGLKEYYKQLQIDCEEIKSLEMLNPSSINNPAIYSLLTSKYHKATEQGIEIKLHISLDLENLNMKVYEFSRILGILLDNAIEACTNCNEKIINLEIRKDERAPRQLLLIQNTYSDKNIDLNRINEKGYTSKTNDTKQHGLGLWEVQKILRKSKNLNLYTTKDAIFFTQQLEMYNL
jgi:two-component system sensor histidine kinase AgrC